MFYADDAVFVGQWNDSNITTLVHVLECFYRVSGLKINMGKSKIMGVHVDNAKVSRAAVKLGCLILKAHFSYLGSIVGGDMNKLQTWNDIVDRVKRRLSKWKMTTLSIRGRLTLVKSVLGSIPIFHMAMFKVLSGVLRTLESIRSHFLMVMIFKVRRFHRGLMFKWAWRFLNHDTSLWARVIKAIHGVDGNIGMGTGEDSWNEGGKLKDRFPRLYTLETCKWVTVGRKIAQPSLMHSFRRPPRGGAEQAQMEELETLMQSVILTPISDRMTWTLDSSGEFSVASVRKLIDNKLLPEGDHETRWIKFVPIKVNIHAWKVMADSLPTRFNISRRGIDIDSLVCVNCDRGVETSRHLFFEYCMAKQVTQLINRWWNVSDMEIDSYEWWKTWSVNIRMPSRNKKMLEGVYYVMWWLIWSFRNKKIFEDKRRRWLLSLRLLVAPGISHFLFEDDFESDFEFEPLEDPSEEDAPDPYEATIARWRADVLSRSSSSSSSSSSSASVPPVSLLIVPALPGLPRRHAILVLPGQEISFGRPYRTHPNGVLRMLTAGKRVYPFPACIPLYFATENQM
ncbi:RNA-directed DNA polymerase, eukaryota, reverse transcriptase zinc-binding domain protein [Tanacetum coccineum]|uniref:RNA-directed DNA polymerase, eukaryota, reverse transcriptase zinc-binding domain protein n=1 Tax=Tanacetum coccineum TaxID=301880 RepID=A0ABQ5E9Z3_9ASTR